MSATVESAFYAVLKTEFFYLNKFTSVEQLRDALAEYIRYYSHDRIETRPKGLSPVRYRTQLAMA